MKRIQKLYKNLIKDLEKNIKNKEDLDYTLKAISNYLEDINEEVKRKLDILEESQKSIITKVSNINKRMDKIESDLYIEEDYEEETNFEICCPYCNNKFETEIENFDEDIECPECNNIIELEVGEECSGCDECGGCKD